jgi:hypothetical protein
MHAVKKGKVLLIANVRIVCPIRVETTFVACLQVLPIRGCTGYNNAKRPACRFANFEQNPYLPTFPFLPTLSK